MGDEEACVSACVESTLGYHSSIAAILTGTVEARLGTLSGGQFDWGKPAIIHVIKRSKITF